MCWINDEGLYDIQPDFSTVNSINSTRTFFFFFAVEHSIIILCSFSFEFLYAVVSMGYPKVNGDSYQYHALDDK